MLVSKLKLHNNQASMYVVYVLSITCNLQFFKTIFTQCYSMSKVRDHPRETYLHFNNVLFYILPVKVPRPLCAAMTL